MEEPERRGPPAGDPDSNKAPRRDPPSRRPKIEPPERDPPATQRRASRLIGEAFLLRAARGK
jgi:hypothetical protein